MTNKLTQAGVARAIGVTPRTVRLWYEYVETHGAHKGMPPLPKYEKIQVGKNQQYLFKESDIPKLEAYRDAMPKTRQGFMAKVTNRYRTEK